MASLGDQRGEVGREPVVIASDRPVAERIGAQRPGERRRVDRRALPQRPYGSGRFDPAVSSVEDDRGDVEQDVVEHAGQRCRVDGVVGAPPQPDRRGTSFELGDRGTLPPPDVDELTNVPALAGAARRSPADERELSG